jgi:hypothetical protein
VGLGGRSGAALDRKPGAALDRKPGAAPDRKPGAAPDRLHQIRHQGRDVFASRLPPR